ncbi:MAG: glycoside hydrolase family 65 protein, partial [Bacilli bacterium]|nr:glycoside hydrolase family 65 protein [Bacilli bacterium]
DIHLVKDQVEKKDDMILIHSKTKRTDKDVFVGVLEERNFEVTDMAKTKSISKFRMTLRPDKVYTVYKYAGVLYNDPEAKEKLKEQLTQAKETGFKTLYQRNEEFFEHMYEIAAVNVYNNDTARDITEYAVYQLIAHRPANDHVSVPMMGLSGQYGYGAVEWSAELMIMPFYINTDTESARHMVMYRVHGLDEAKKRARNYGYDGALYPVLSGANGVELDPKEIENMIHVNGSIIYGVYQYIERAADYSVLFEGALEMLLEMCRFYLSYAKLSDNKKHYDFLRVRGIDNSHGKIDNEVYTNKVIDNALDAVIKCVAFAKQTDKAEVKTMFDEKNYEELIKELRELRRRLYTKKENIDYIVEAFDGYLSLPDKEVSSLKRIRFRETDRYIDYRESSYVQNSSALITLAMFREEFPDIVHRTCYDYYMRRSVNPDYFARTMYIIEACESNLYDDALDAYNGLGDLDIKNPILFKNGLNLGLLGGLYQAVVYGFSGVRHHVYLVSADYHIPPNIRRITCKLRVVDNIAYVKVKRNSASVKWSETDDDDDD